jgi:SAM-dependent methyltransferase
MPGTIANEVSFVRRAIRRHGAPYESHLRTKGFTSEWFLHQWAAVTEVANRLGIGPRVLDLGCGPGWTSIFLAGRGCAVTGADVAPDMLRLARENAARLGLAIDFRRLDMRRPFPWDASFDTVLLFDALHHCPDERTVLRNCYEALAPGGKVVLVEPDWFHEFSPSSAQARRDFGTTERGMGYGRMRRALRAAGFVRPRRVYASYSTCGGSPWERIKALAIAALTLTVGFPHRSVIAVARRP